MITAGLFTLHVILVSGTIQDKNGASAYNTGQSLLTLALLNMTPGIQNQININKVKSFQ